MKNVILLSVLLLFTINSFAQKITRGPDIGEIYFLGPTHTTGGLYYSANFGESATCVDSNNFIKTIAADVLEGGLYCVMLPANLYYSNNYGNTNSWVYKNYDVSDNINCGLISGHLYSGCYKHSLDYGVNFIYHNLNGYFGEFIFSIIDNFYESTGYILTYKLDVIDTVYLFRTYNTFENVNLIHKFNYLWY
ncbi:MAG: hypothetical protein R2764_25335, partial [Bacteroidales bacterium]